MGALKHIESICLGDNLLDESGLAALEVRTSTTSRGQIMRLTP